MAFGGLLQHRQECAGVVVDPEPADAERLVPLLARARQQAAATTDAGIVEQKVDLVGPLLFGHLVAKALDLIFDRHVGDVRRDAQSLR